MAHGPNSGDVVSTAVGGPAVGDARVTGVVLAGGASSRFGSPKAAAELAGRPLISYPLDAMRAAGLPVLIVAKADNDLTDLAGGAELLVEPDEPRHPLRGIVSALQYATGPIVVCACDMPFVGGGVIKMLAGLPDNLAVAQAGGFPQPMLGRYTPAVLDVLAESLAAEVSVRDTLIRAGARLLPPEALAPFGDPDRIVRDIDTREDLDAAEADV